MKYGGVDPRKLLSADKLITNYGATLTSGSFGSQNLREPAVAILNSSGYSNHCFFILEIIERGILTAWGHTSCPENETDKRDF